MKLTQTFVLILMANLLFAQAGNLDMTFGDGGKMVTTFEQLSSEANSMALQSDGKIVVAGIGISDEDEDIIAVRYLQNGQLDTTFGMDGKFILSISDFRDRCYDVEIDNLDNIYLTGITFNDDFKGKGFVIKLNTFGAIDSTFAQHGIWISQTPDTREDFREILLQENGKIVIAGKVEITGQFSACTIIRLNPNGTLDAGFGENGIAMGDVPDGYNPSFAKFNSNQEIITGGFLLESTVNSILIKFNPLGVVDSSFGTNGVMVDNSGLDEFAYDIAILDNGKILLVAGLTNGSGRDFGLTRYNQDGALDHAFGVNGKISTDFIQTSNTAHAVIIQEDGKIILSGFLGITPNHDYAIARYDSLGQLDGPFGMGGRVITDIEQDDSAFTSILQADGKLLCAGNSKTTQGVSSFSIARYTTQTGTNTTGIVKNQDAITLFPNPSNGPLMIRFSDAGQIASDVHVTVTDQTGKEWLDMTHKTLDSVFAVELESLPAGIYFITLRTAGQWYNGKVVRL